MFRPAIGLPPGLMIGIGAFLVCYGTFAFWLGTNPNVRLVWLVIVGNLLWVADSVATLWLFPLTGVGTALVIAQAAAVLGFAVTQIIGVSGSARGTRPRPRHPVAP